MLAAILFSVAIAAAAGALTAELADRRPAALTALALGSACATAGSAARDEAWSTDAFLLATLYFALLTGLNVGKRLWSPTPGAESED